MSISLNLPMCHMYLLTYLLHGAESFLRSQLVLQLVKKFPTFYGTRKFITVLTSARHLSVSWANSIQSTQPPPTSWRSILIFSHLRLGLPSCLFPSGFPTRTLCTPLPSPIRATCPTHLILDFTTRMLHVQDVKITCVTVCGIKLIQMYQYYIFELLAVIKQAIRKCFELQTMNVTCHNKLKIIHWVQRRKMLLSEICHWHSLECCSANWKQVTCGTVFFWSRRQRVGTVFNNTEVDTAWGGYMMYHSCK